MFANAPVLEMLEKAVGEELACDDVGSVETFTYSPDGLSGGRVDATLLLQLLKVRHAKGSYRFDQGDDLAKQGPDAMDALQQFARQIESVLLEQSCHSSLRGNVPVPLVLRFTRGFRKGLQGQGFEHDFYCGHVKRDEGVNVG